MATGANIQGGRGIVTSGVTPGIDFRTGEGQVWEEAGRVFEKYAEATKPDMLRRAAARGAIDGAAVADGAPMPERGLLSFGPAAEARQAALESAYTARIRNDIDARESQLRQEHRYDPDAYEQAAASMRSGFIQGAPPEFAVDVETYASDRVSRGAEVVRSARIQRDDQETTQALGVRTATLQEDMIAMAARGETGTPDFWRAQAEYETLQNQRESNPAIMYSPDQRVLDDEKLGDAMTLATVNRDALREYADQGRGQPGFAAAARYLQENLLDNPAFENIAPGRRAKMHRDAMQELRAYTQADREEERAAAEAERARNAARRELVGDFRLRVLLGEATEADIQSDTTLSDGDKASLIAGARASQRREAAAAAAEARATSLESYRGLMDQAAAGTLTSDEIADARGAGLITPEQARTARSYNDQQLRPIIEQVMDPVKDYMRRPGMSTRPDINSRRSIAEEAATRFARENPAATIDQRLAAGRAIADSVFGAGRTATPAGQAQRQQGQAAQLSALAAERQRRQGAGSPMSMSEYNRRRTEIMNGSTGD